MIGPKRAGSAPGRHEINDRATTEHLLEPIIQQQRIADHRRRSRDRPSTGGRLARAAPFQHEAPVGEFRAHDGSRARRRDRDVVIGRRCRIEEASQARQRDCRRGGALGQAREVGLRPQPLECARRRGQSKQKDER